MFNGMEFRIMDLTKGSALTPLDRETRTVIPTNEAAPHLGRSQQTLRVWACHECGPIRPVRIHGRLLWPVADIRRLVGVSV